MIYILLFEQKWCYSTSFSPVTKWEHRDKAPLLNHLKVCPFNQDKSFTHEQWSYMAGLESVYVEMESENMAIKPSKIQEFQNNQSTSVDSFK